MPVNDHLPGLMRHQVRKQGYSPNTYNKHIATLRMIFRSLPEWRTSGPTPFDGIRALRLDPKSRRDLTDEHTDSPAARVILQGLFRTSAE